MEKIISLLGLLLLAFLYNPIDTIGNIITPQNETNQQRYPDKKAEALKYYADKNYHKAIEIWTEILQLDPNDASTANNIGTAYRQLRQPEIALDYARKAIELSPDYAHPYYSVGLAYYDLRNFDKAKEAFEEAIKRGYKPGGANYNLGLSFYHLRQYPKAREAFLQAIEKEYDLSSSYHQLGLTEYGLEEYKGAAKAFEKAVKIAPSAHGTHYYLGLCYLELKKPYEARKAFERERELKTRFSSAAFQKIDKVEEQIIENQGKTLAFIAMFAIPALLLLYSRKSKDYYKPDLQKVLLLVTFLIFLPLPFLLFVIPPLFVGWVFYPYLFSSFVVIGIPTMIGGPLVYIGFFFSTIYLTVMVFLTYWTVCFLFKNVKDQRWFWALMGAVIAASFFDIYAGATIGGKSSINWINMIKTVISSWGS